MRSALIWDPAGPVSIDPGDLVMAVGVAVSSPLSPNSWLSPRRPAPRRSRSRGPGTTRGCGRRRNAPASPFSQYRANWPGTSCTPWCERRSRGRRQPSRTVMASRSETCSRWRTPSRRLSAAPSRSTMRPCTCLRSQPRRRARRPAAVVDPAALSTGRVHGLAARNRPDATTSEGLSLHSIEDPMSENIQIADALRRPLGHLRLSVTDRCNLRCQYCMPEDEYD